ncbi:MAG: hypothetical protein MUD01_15850 [Chloroflexaceae bacterium]|jgi:hypothetical protein|nr:hypothetical protein [Chloroflexaceae bacterium]
MWRFVQQTDGLFARFSEVVDMVEDYSLSPDEAIELAIIEDGLTPQQAYNRLNNAVEAGRDRLSWALSRIERKHGILARHEAEYRMGVLVA